MQVILFIVSNWDSALIIIAASTAVIALIKKGEKRILQGSLYGLVTKAERQFGGGTGELKYIAVSDWIYERIPAILRYLFTKNDIQKMIEAALTIAKEKWVQNVNLKTYISGETPE